MSRWLQPLQELCRGGRTCVAVTVAAAKGSAPRDPGTKMLVLEDVICGTIGGGHLELKAIEIARNMLAVDSSATASTLHRFPLGASLGQCCGGIVNLLFERLTTADNEWVERLARWERDQVSCVMITPGHGAAANKLLVTTSATYGRLGDGRLEVVAIEVARQMLGAVSRDPRLVDLGAHANVSANRLANAPALDTILLFEPVYPSRFRIVLFGAGHVGRALIDVLAHVDCHITWVDARDAEFPDSIPDNVTVELSDVPETAVDHAPADSYFLVMTHSHALDFELVQRILRRGDFSYLGLIGSATKRKSFVKRLTQRGVPEETLERITCPIGIHGIEGKEPASIAIAVAAELLRLREAIDARKDVADQHLRSA